MKKKENLVTNLMSKTFSKVTSSHEEFKREQLKTFLAKRLPTMFDRDPVITGNLDLLVDEILDL